MTQAAPSSETVETDVEPMLAVYRHDVHKGRGRGHANAESRWGEIRVNEPVPLGADADAAMLSRPSGDPEQTVDNHGSPYRLSLLTGEVVGSVDGPEEIRSAFQELVSLEDPVEMHKAWLDSSVAAVFNESEYYPYTSLKYHTLLTAALLDTYRAGFAFEDLYLRVTPPDDLTPHRTLLKTPQFGLRLTGNPDPPASRLGDHPSRSFADVWSRLPEHPIPVERDRRWRILDAQLRRIRSWSTALQYIEDFVAWADRDDVHGMGDVNDG